MLESHDLPDETSITVPGVVPKLSRTPGRTRWLGPEFDANRELILEVVSAIRGECKN